jgi:tetratricopeptide (TPR) repeat protein
MIKTYIADVGLSTRRFMHFMAIAAVATVVGTGLSLAAGGDTAPQPDGCTDNDASTPCDDNQHRDNRIYQQGAQLALSGQYERAIALLRTANDQNDPRILNYIGYSFRKMGQFGTGIAYYSRALEADPNYVLAREYLGEGFVSIGRIDKAEEQLAEIEQRCGVSCEEYQQLAQVISDANSGLSSDW